MLSYGDRVQNHDVGVDDDADAEGDGYGCDAAAGTQKSRASEPILEEGEDDGDFGSLLLSRGPVNSTSPFPVQTGATNGAVVAVESAAPPASVVSTTANSYMFVNTNGFMGTPKLDKAEGWSGGAGDRDDDEEVKEKKRSRKKNGIFFLNKNNISNIKMFFFTQCEK